ncbi:acyltransferase family protein [Rhodoblastus sp.]|uniref:acyltransferase family protein n=1 Tax=Rhodoblastus sp. TaxID=1962975 RepID=UPI003F9D43CC
MICLGDTRGRDNNFDLIRVVAALTVLFVHSAALSRLTTGSTGLTSRYFDGAAVAVDVFFFTSGFLVTGSLFGRGNIFEYAWARLMRIFPALWLMLLVTVTGLGLFVGTLPAAEFFLSPVTHDYVRHCATLVNGVRYQLPGLFADNPYTSSVNGSLWTLPIEWRLYEYLAGGWVLLALRPAWRGPAFRYGTAAAALILMAMAIRVFFVEHARASTLVPTFMFFYGAALQMWRSRVNLSYFRGAALLAALATARLSSDAILPVYLVTLGPLVLHAAYLLGGPIRAYNRVGDYSYGVYIYAFPIQQALIALIPGLSLILLNIYASALTLCCAVLSWHFLEKPALDWKLTPAAATERLFERLRESLSDWRRRRAA